MSSNPRLRYEGSDLLHELTRAGQYSITLGVIVEPAMLIRGCGLTSNPSRSNSAWEVEELAISAPLKREAYSRAQECLGCWSTMLFRRLSPLLIKVLAMPSRSLRSLPLERSLPAALLERLQGELRQSITGHDRCACKVLQR